MRKSGLQEQLLYNTLFACRSKLSQEAHGRNFLYDEIEEGTDIVEGAREFTEADLLNAEVPNQ